MGIREIRDRTAARRLAGANQTYPEHAGKAALPRAKVAARALPVLPCEREGPVLVPCHSCRSEARHVRDCELHGQCTREDAGRADVQVCARCPDHTRPAPPSPLSPAA